MKKKTLKVGLMYKDVMRLKRIKMKNQTEPPDTGCIGELGHYKNDWVE